METSIVVLLIILGAISGTLVIHAIRHDLRAKSLHHDTTSEQVGSIL